MVQEAGWVALGALIGTGCTLAALAAVQPQQPQQQPKSGGGRCGKKRSTATSPGVPPSPGAAEGRAAVRQHCVEVEYCAGCRWMQRAGWVAMELLTTFSAGELRVVLVPNHAKPGGVFEVRVDGAVVFDRKAQAPKPRFPEMKEVKQLVRDAVTPSRDLGHSDRP